jgi:hypothetical protein
VIAIIGVLIGLLLPAVQADEEFDKREATGSSRGTVQIHLLNAVTSPRQRDLGPQAVDALHD